MICTDIKSTICPEVDKIREQLIKWSSKTENPPLIYKTSTITNAGWGVFTQVELKKGQMVTEYDGELIPVKEGYRRRKLKLDTHIRSKISMAWCIDGRNLRDGVEIKDPTSQCEGYGMAAFFNDGKDNKEGNNMEFVVFHCAANSELMNGDRNPSHSIVYTAATCDIKPQSELFLSYGVDYWKMRR